jgi:hypothetical protein
MEAARQVPAGIPVEWKRELVAGLLPLQPAGYPLVTVCFSMLSKDKEVLSCHAGDQCGTTLSCVDMAPIKN